VTDPAHAARVRWFIDRLDTPPEGIDARGVWHDADGAGSLIGAPANHSDSRRLRTVRRGGAPGRHDGQGRARHLALRLADARPRWRRSVTCRYGGGCPIPASRASWRRV